MVAGNIVERTEYELLPDNDDGNVYVCTKYDGMMDRFITWIEPTMNGTTEPSF
jgi:hypothetical protein